MSVADTLAALKPLLAAITVPSAPAVYVYPDDGVNWKAALAPAALPAIFARESVTRQSTWGRVAFGKGVEYYEIELLIACRAIRDVPVDLRIGELAARGWRKAVADILYANQTLTGTISIVGRVNSTGGGQLFEASTGIVIPDEGETKTPYYGMAIYFGVKEIYAQTMSA